MLSLIGIGISIAVSVIAYVQTRDFVRRRLRYVDKVQTPIAPWIAGLAVALIGLPIAAFLPFVGLGTAHCAGSECRHGCGARRARHQARRIGALSPEVVAGGEWTRARACLARDPPDNLDHRSPRAHDAAHRILHSMAAMTRIIQRAALAAALLIFARGDLRAQGTIAHARPRSREHRYHLRGVRGFLRVRERGMAQAHGDSGRVFLVRHLPRSGRSWRRRLAQCAGRCRQGIERSRDQRGRHFLRDVHGYRLDRTTGRLAARAAPREHQCDLVASRVACRGRASCSSRESPSCSLPAPSPISRTARASFSRSTRADSDFPIATTTRERIPSRRSFATRIAIMSPERSRLRASPRRRLRTTPIACCRSRRSSPRHR